MALRLALIDASKAEMHRALAKHVVVPKSPGALTLQEYRDRINAVVVGMAGRMYLPLRQLGSVGVQA